MRVDYFRTVGREEQSKKANFGGNYRLAEVDALPTVAGLRCKPRPATSRARTALFAHSEFCLFFCFSLCKCSAYKASLQQGSAKMVVLQATFFTQIGAQF